MNCTAGVKTGAIGTWSNGFTRRLSRWRQDELLPTAMADGDATCKGMATRFLDRSSRIYEEEVQRSSRANDPAQISIAKEQC